MSILDFQRSRFNQHIEIGGQLPDNKFNGRPWDYRAYQNAVRSHLNRISASRTGEIIISAMTRSLLIVPRTEEDGNAEARVVSSTAPGFRTTDAPISTGLDTRNAVMEGVAISQPLRNSPLQHSILGVLNTGSGQGADVVIEFTPGFHSRGSALQQNNLFLGRATELLLHEMVHAMLGMRGLIDPTPTTGAAAGYHGRNEFNAIMVTNIYRSELSPTAALRGSHHMTWENLDNPEQFYTRHRTLVDAFCNKVPQIARRLAGIRRATFNPCADHFLARAHARSRTA
ncbi:MAG: M91 family zinc metallopeptidase [Pseudomonadota bacterium]